jgi:small subunit ribosomal protein S8
MPLTDPLGDLLTRIRNAQKANFKSLDVPGSKLKAAVCEVLQREGYIRGYFSAEKEGQNMITVELKYSENEPVIRQLKRISTPGRRVYAGIKDLPKVANGLGISILSTPRGVMSDNEARAANVGGEVLCQIF